MAFTSSARNFLMRSGYPTEKVDIIPMAIDTDLFRPRGNGVWLREKLNIEDHPVILSVARLHKSKGLDLLLRALSMIKWMMPEVKLVIVGQGPQEGYLRTLTRTLSLEENVIFLTEIIRNELMPEVYAMCASLSSQVFMSLLA